MFGAYGISIGIIGLIRMTGFFEFLFLDLLPSYRRYFVAKIMENIGNELTEIVEKHSMMDRVY